MPARLKVCVNHPPALDAAAFREAVRSSPREVELHVLPFKESLGIRRVRAAGSADAEVLAQAPQPDAAARALLSDAEALLALDLPPAILEACPNLGFVQAFSSGIEHLPVEALQARGVAVATAAGAGAGPIAEFALARILEVWKELRDLGSMQRERRFRRPGGRVLAGCTLGVVGLGAIGNALAERAAALGMRVVATRAHPERGAPPGRIDEVMGPAELPRLLATADVVALCLPHTPETTDLMDAEALAAMKPGAVLCNVARGALVDEEALLEALSSEQLSAAILDVTREEPLPAESPLWSAPNVYLSPHSAVSPEAYVDSVLELFARNLCRYAAGEAPENLVAAVAGPGSAGEGLPSGG